MKIYLIRHAEAVAGSPGLPDERRYLTPEGRVSFRKTARTMLKKGVEPDLILTSPLIRAVQTADILAEQLSYIGLLPVATELAPGFDLEGLRKLLASFRPVRELVLVGHEPDMGMLVSTLASFEGEFRFKKGMAVKLKLDPAALDVPATLSWVAEGKKLLPAEEVVPKYRGEADPDEERE